MKKDVLKGIKDYMKGYRSYKKEVRAKIKAAEAELEEWRKEELAKLKRLSDETGGYAGSHGAYICLERDSINNASIDLEEILDEYDACDTFYLIYEDGKDVVISAEDIITGDQPFPKLTHIAYASHVNECECWDTEIGDLPWYNAERMEACDWDFEAEAQAQDDYNTAIQVKYGTVWAEHYLQKHPDYVLPTDEEIANMVNIVKETVSKTEEIAETVETVEITNNESTDTIPQKAATALTAPKPKSVTPDFAISRDSVQMYAASKLIEVALEKDSHKNNSVNAKTTEKHTGTVNKEKVLERIDAMLTKAFVEKMKHIFEDLHIPYIIEGGGRIPLPDKSRSPPKTL